MRVSESVELLLVFVLVILAEAGLYFLDRWIHGQDQEG